jgi:hypothetical protein|tara:strand:+ start:943 stop:1221 length:279 start_codon:yes stop_codon:yes gene_type:complete
MFESLMNNATMLVGGGSAGIILWILKKVPNDNICAFVESLFYGAGKAITLGLSKWSFTKNFWNNTIEPWFIDLLDNVVGGAVRGFIKGLRVD